MVAILRDMEAEEQSAEHEHRLRDIIQWTLKVIDRDCTNPPVSKSKSHTDHLLSTMISDIRTLSLTTGSMTKDAGSIQRHVLSRTEQDLVHAFSMVAHFKQRWDELYHEVFIERLWPLVHSPGAMNIIICIMGTLLSLKSSNVVRSDGGEPDADKLHVRDVLQKLLIVIDGDTRSDFGLVTQMYAVDYLARLSAVDRRRTTMDKSIRQLTLDLDVHYHLLSWVERNRNHTVRETSRELDFHFPHVHQLFDKFGCCV